MEKIKSYIKAQFKNLDFDEKEHKYFINKKMVPLSVSGIVHTFEEEFNSMANSLNVSKKLGIPQADVLAMWKKKSDDACNLGTRVHLFGEKYTFNRKIKPKDSYEEGLKKFIDEIPEYIIPVIMELRMYHYELNFAGTCDSLWYNTKTDKFILTDYKTNEDLFKNFKGKTLINGFENLLDNPFNKYQIQLSLYQMMFEQIGYEIEDRKIIWIKPNGTYEKISTENLIPQLNKLLYAGKRDCSEGTKPL